MAALNYKHLHYFWVVAKTGGVTRAAERLHVTAQTISGQIGVFENVLGFALFERAGRGLEPTEAGRIVLGYADAIFRLGAELEDELRNRPHGPTPRFRAGIADVMPKSMAYGLLDSVSHRPDSPRIVCREGTLDSLLADLAVHRLDIVLADRPMPANLAVRGYSHLLGECGLTFFATTKLARRHKGSFPQLLDGAPLLLPGEDSDVRPRLLRWLDRQRIVPRIVGEFDDDALLKAFGEGGAGIFPGPTAIASAVERQYGVVAVGGTNDVMARFYAITGERQVKHPAVLAITSTARRQLFRQRPS